MTVITNASHPKLLWPGVRAVWGIEYNQRQPIWPQFFEELTSDKAYEEDVETIGFGLAPIKDQAAGISYDTAQQGTVSRYTHVTYGLGYMVTLEELSDNLYEKASFKRTARLARSMRETEEIVHANIFNRAFNTSFTGGDGKALIATDHPTANGTQSNRITTNADISEAAIEDLCIQIMGSTDSRGLKFLNKPRCLMVPDAVWFEANRIVNSVLQNDTSNNAVNVIKSSGLLPDGVKQNTYLTDTDAWFIRTDCPEGTTHFQSWETVFDKDNDFSTKNLLVSAIERFSCGWTNFRQWFASQGA